MDIRDSQRIKEIRDNTRAMAEAVGRIADTLAEALELYVSTQTETQNSNLTFEKADEPQTDEEYINNLPWTEVGNGEQTENLFTDKDGDVWEWRGDAWYCISGDEPQTDCAWK